MTRYGRFVPEDPFHGFLLTDHRTPRPWQVYLVNERQMTQIDQFGHGYARYWNEKGQDVGVLPEGGPPSSRMIAIRDDSTPGAPVIWSPAASSWGGIVNNRLDQSGKPPFVPEDAVSFMVTPLVVPLNYIAAELLLEDLFLGGTAAGKLKVTSIYVYSVTP